MPIQSCDPAVLGPDAGSREERVNAPDGSGYVGIKWRFTWDGVSAWPDCDGQVTMLEYQNSSAMPAWAELPAKKQGVKWIVLDPHTPATTITKRNDLVQLGLSNNSDIQPQNRLTFTAPTG